LWAYAIFAGADSDKASPKSISELLARSYDENKVNWGGNIVFGLCFPTTLC